MRTLFRAHFVASLAVPLLVFCNLSKSTKQSTETAKVYKTEFYILNGDRCYDEFTSYRKHMLEQCQVLNLNFNSVKPGVPFMGHRQTE